ncbi:ASCH domain-containing protein [Acinetobacter sp. AM]|uniref:ASCH domain-containing protein n=1 Tax=Acinetobacter sp. AM TaxID=2170730 RepID=UPI000DE74484|nr:ASCH domain-containing protein [Acinetobacter sp. AM]PWB17591.1 ASCH domain-containing protein [Acinetobacter sp. AM]
MRKLYQALSIVAPSGEYIAQGVKTLEIRSWRPEQLPLKNLIIVENTHYLNQCGDEEEGRAVAWVDITSVHAWKNTEIESAKASYWQEGYWAWVIENVRPIHPPVKTIARRKIYWVELEQM